MRLPGLRGQPPLSPELLRAYVAAAKSHDPFFPEELTGTTPRAQS